MVNPARGSDEQQFDKILNEIRKSKSDIEEKIEREVGKIKIELENTIVASEGRLKLKIEDLNKKIEDLETENNLLKKQVEILSRDNKKKNVVIFGLKPTAEEVLSLNFICGELNNLLNTQICPNHISNFYPIGDRKNIIKLEFISQITKQYILKNCKKLKGTGITIAHDLTKAQQIVNKTLRKHLKSARENKNQKSYIKGEKLFIDNIPYSLEDLEETEEIDVEHESAPSTLTPLTFSNRASELSSNNPSSKEAQKIGRSNNNQDVEENKKEDKINKRGNNLDSRYRTRLNSQQK